MNMALDRSNHERKQVAANIGCRSLDDAKLSTERSTNKGTN